MSELDDAVAAVRDAILNEGPKSAYHRAVMARHRRKWPTLWSALDRLLAVGAPPLPLTIEEGSPIQRQEVRQAFQTMTFPRRWLDGRTVRVVFRDFQGHPQTAGGGTIVLPTRTRDTAVWWIFGHELGHLADFWVLTPEKRAVLSLPPHGSESWAHSFARVYVPAGKTYPMPHDPIADAVLRVAMG